MRVSLVLLALAFGVANAQGTKTREDPSKYSAHAQIGAVGLGADLWGHYIPLEGTSLKTGRYLVVEVALFAPPSAKVAISPSQFVLKANGQTLTPQPSGLVTIGITVPEMRERGPHLEADGGVGPITVSDGRDPVQRKFPGDTNPADIPLPPRASSPDDELKADPVDPVKAVNDAALPEGSHATPISGYLFFAWPGKLKSLKHAEIDYKSEIGTATLSLR